MKLHFQLNHEGWLSWSQISDMIIMDKDFSHGNKLTKRKKKKRWAYVINACHYYRVNVDPRLIMTHKEEL